MAKPFPIEWMITHRTLAELLASGAPPEICLDEAELLGAGEKRLREYREHFSGADIKKLADGGTYGPSETYAGLTCNHDWIRCVPMACLIVFARRGLWPVISSAAESYDTGWVIREIVSDVFYAGGYLIDDLLIPRYGNVFTMLLSYAGVWPTKDDAIEAGKQRGHLDVLTVQLRSGPGCYQDEAIIRTVDGGFHVIGTGRPSTEANEDDTRRKHENHHDNT